VNADIIQFISRPKREDAQTDFPTIAFRTALREPLIGSVDATPDQHGGLPASCPRPMSAMRGIFAGSVYWGNIPETNFNCV